MAALTMPSRPGSDQWGVAAGEGVTAGSRREASDRMAPPLQRDGHPSRAEPKVRDCVDPRRATAGIGCRNDDPTGNRAGRLTKNAQLRGPLADRKDLHTAAHSPALRSLRGEAPNPLRGLASRAIPSGSGAPPAR